MSIFLPLIVGTSIYITSKNSKIDSLEKILKEHDSFSLMEVTPTHLKILKEQLTLESIQKQKGNLIIGGENLRTDDIRFWLEAAPDTTIFNGYGPTEITIGCCVFALENDNISSSGSIPIGRPISNTQIYILDSYMNPVPIGIAGEIYIGGVGLSRGYLNRADLTAEKFVPNPFVLGMEEVSKETVSKKLCCEKVERLEYKSDLRLYRTGDLACYLPDGNVDFIGRIDEQVKLRGFRIELGEIESTLNTHKDVVQVVVVAREDKTGDKLSEKHDNMSSHKQLVAYVVPGEMVYSSLEKILILTSSSKEEFSVLNGENIPTLTEGLRNHLIRFLPEYMIPAFFVYLDKIPLTSSGKIDRKSLPAPDLSLRQVGDEYVAPTSRVEQKLNNIWSKVLRIERIGVHDNFFKIGGHSLLATQVISRAIRSCNIDIPLRSIFEHPTIRALGQEIEYLTKINILSLIPLITAQDRPDSIPLSFAQQRLWFLDQLLPGKPLYNIPMALKLKGMLESQALEKALRYITQRHEVLRSRIKTQGGEAYQVIMPESDFCFERIDLSLLPFQEQEAALGKCIEEDATKPFDLEKDSLIRGTLLTVQEEEHILLLNMHHIVSDGWSFDILLQELKSAYKSYKMGQEPFFPELIIQYADFALWQRKWLQGEVLTRQLEYWKQELGTPEIITLPTDYPRPYELSYRGGVYHHHLPKAFLMKIKTLSEREGTTLFMTLLGAFQVLLYRITHQEDIIVGSPIANRHYKEIEGLIGFFVNTLALRAHLSGENTFTEILRQVKETTLNAYAHQDVPFEQLVEHLEIARELNRNPVFQVMFGFQNAGNIPFELEGIEAQFIGKDTQVAKFDLSLYAEEREEGLYLGFEYAKDLFEASTIERLGRHFERLLEGIILEVTVQ